MESMWRQWCKSSDKLLVEPTGPHRSGKSRRWICSEPRSCHRHCWTKRCRAKICKWFWWASGKSLEMFIDYYEDKDRATHLPNLIWRQSQDSNAAVISFVPLKLIIAPHQTQPDIWFHDLILFILKCDRNGLSTNFSVATQNIFTYDVDELHESQAESYVDLLCHILYGSDEFVIPSEQVSNQSLFIFTSGN